MADKKKAQQRSFSIRIDEQTYNALRKQKYETRKTIMEIVREAVV